MSAISLAKKNFNIPSCQKLFNDLYTSGYLSDNVLDTIFLDPKFDYLEKLDINNNDINTNKCMAREWKIENKDNIDYVLDNIQCQKDKLNGSCFCIFHNKKNETMPNGWWLGKINEPRPDPLYHPGSKNPITGKYDKPIQHQWTYEIKKSKETDIINETPIDEHKDKDKEKPKRKRGRPPGSKNKKNKNKNKNKDKDKDKDKDKGLTIIDEQPKEKFIFDYEEENDTFKYEVDGFAYSTNIDGDVINPHTYEYMGQSDGNGGINFIDSDAVEKHKVNISTI